MCNFACKLHIVLSRSRTATPRDVSRPVRTVTGNFAVLVLLLLPLTGILPCDLARLPFGGLANFDLSRLVDVE
eukprot:3001601-Amphidinium_carterae.1